MIPVVYVVIGSVAAAAVFVFVAVVFCLDSHDRGLKRGYFAVLAEDREILEELSLARHGQPVEDLLSYKATARLKAALSSCRGQALVTEDSVTIIPAAGDVFVARRRSGVESLDAMILRAVAASKGEGEGCDLEVAPFWFGERPTVAGLSPKSKG